MFDLLTYHTVFKIPDRIKHPAYTIFGFQIEILDYYLLFLEHVMKCNRRRSNENSLRQPVVQTGRLLQTSVSQC